MKTFGYKDVLNKYNNETKVQCYLTGDWIDLTQDDYSFDHIVPLSRGGSCELNNLGIVTPIANMAKSSMLESEFVELCKKVLQYRGYKIEDPS
jgi:5-methylcytosine-specific restriction endonuclease McrA